MKRKEEEEVPFINPFVSYSLWHLPWLAGVCENFLQTLCSRGGPVQRWHLWKQASRPKPRSKALIFFPASEKFVCGFGFLHSIAPDLLKIPVCKCQIPSWVQGESRKHLQTSVQCSVELTISIARQWDSQQQHKKSCAGEAVRKSPRKPLVTCIIFKLCPVKLWFH